MTVSIVRADSYQPDAVRSALQSGFDLLGMDVNNPFKDLIKRGDRVFIKRVGNAVVLIPYHEPWQSLFDSLGMFSDDFMEDREQPPHQDRERLFK